MASTISAGLTTTTALVYTADTSGVLQLQTNGTTTAVTIDTNKRVGIGTTSPSYLLQASLPSSTSGVVARFSAPSYEHFDIYAGSTKVSIGSASGATPLGFNISGLEVGRFDGSGNLLVGETSQSNSEKFGVVGSNGGAMIYGRNTSASGFAGQFVCDNSSWSAGSVVYFGISGYSPNNTARSFLYASDSTSLRFQLYSNGGIANYSANNVNLSDATMKKDITPAKSYLSILNQIPVVTFLFNDQTDTEANLGVTAQSVQAVAPELVGTMNLGTTETPNVKLAIYETDLKYAMLKAIQELSAQVTTLQSQVAALTPKA